MARISTIYFCNMRKIAFLLVLLAGTASTQVQNWDPVPFMEHGSIRFNDDLDFFLNSYTKEEIKEMRNEVSIWRMNFDKMIRATIADIQAYSEGGTMVRDTHDFTLTEVRTGEPYTLSAHKGKLRAFMFGSISNPPARAQLPFWDKLRAKYDTALVDLFVIYGKELHPGDRKKFSLYPAPSTMDQKIAYAKDFAQLTKLPVLVDSMSDAVLRDYGMVPNGAYVVDAEGRLIFRATWADSRKIEQILDTVLKWVADGRPTLRVIR